MKNIKHGIGIILAASLISLTACTGTAKEGVERMPTDKEVVQTYQSLRDSLAQKFAETYEEYETELSETTLPDIASKPKQTP